MSFQEKLSAIVTSVPGARAAILMGLDGIAVAEATAKEGKDSMQDAAVEYSRVLAEAVKIAQGNNLGALNETVLTTEQSNFVFRVLNDTYFVGLLLDRDGNVGRGRFVLRRDARLLVSEL